VKGRVIEAVVRDLAAGGEGVVPTEDGTFLVRGAIPGERVRLAVEKKDARLLAVLDASPDRVEAICVDADACGGCPLMIASPAASRTYKLARIERATGLAPEWVEGPALGYRRRARLAFDARRKSLGYRASRSREIVRVRTCHVLDPRLETARGRLAEILDRLTGAGEIALDLGPSGVVASIVTPIAQAEPFYRAAEALVAAGAVAGIELRVEGAAPAVFGDVRSMTLDREGQPLFGPALGFAQANDTVNRVLVERVLELAEPAGKSVLELYAGAGNLTVALARHAKDLTAVERDADLVRALRLNAAERALAVKIVHDDAEAAVARIRRPEVVVLDPPRTGAREVVRALAELRARVIVYVSCDPATLERDGKELTARGYIVDRSVALDMFPQTAHVEAVARFVRA
jgi:23S rRNA (uracil1939-C5)-methyltransferase